MNYAKINNSHLVINLNTVFDLYFSPGLSLTDGKFL